MKCRKTTKKLVDGSQASIIKIYSYTNLQLLNSKKKGPLLPKKRTEAAHGKQGGSGPSGAWLPALLNCKTHMEKSSLREERVF